MVFISIFGLKAQLFQDGFETYNDFIIDNIGTWTLIDVDGNTGTWGAQDFDFTNEIYQGSYIVFNSTSTTPEAIGWEAYSGVKCLVAFDANPANGATNDDWAISEDFTVGENTVLSLWVKSITDEYGLERYNIYLMNGITNSDVVEKLNSGTDYDEAPVYWKQLNYDISSHNGETLRIGIQCVSNDAFAFLIDDVYVGDAYTVTFNVSDGTNSLENANVEIVGNNLTTDASGQATIDLTDGSYKVITSLDGYVNDTTDFTVSGSAADVNITLNAEVSVKDILTKEINISPNPSNGVFNINVDNNYRLEVFDITGRVIDTRKLTGNTTLELDNAGIYFLRFSDDESSYTEKVIVK